MDILVLITFILASLAAIVAPPLFLAYFSNWLLKKRGFEKFSRSYLLILFALLWVSLISLAGYYTLGERSMSPPDSPASIPPPPTSTPPPSIPPQGSEDTGLPWPPPPASATFVFPRRVLTTHLRLHEIATHYIYDEDWLAELWSLQNGPALAHIDAVLNHALFSTGYHEASYYEIPGGFALVTRLEQINADGSPKKDGRWQLSTSRMQRFSILEYIKALFTAKPGYFRVVLFAITDEPFKQEGEEPAREDAFLWLRGGFNALPRDLGARPFTGRHTCTALIYEFEKKDIEREARFLLPGRLSGQRHLQMSGIWGMFQ